MLKDPFEVDQLKLYLGKDYIINDYIKIKQPTIGQIAEMGEKEYYSMVYTLCSISSDMKSQLWDMGIDWNNIEDFELFIMLTRSLTQDQTKVLLGDLDLSKFTRGYDTKTEMPVLFMKKPDLVIPDNKVGLLDILKKKPSEQHEETDDDYIVIDEFVYSKMVSHIRMMHGIIPKVEKAANKATKELLLEDDRDKLAIAMRKKSHSTLQPLVSALVNSAGFKYNIQQLNNLGIYQFMDSVQRIQMIKSADALQKGMYGGFLDVSKLDKNELNWLKDFNGK
mgnify:CR=1 FL=1